MESPVHGRQTIDIRATAKELANILPNLLAAHGLSGCDTVAPCYGIGKMKVLKTLKQGNYSLTLKEREFRIRNKTTYTGKGGSSLYETKPQNEDFRFV